jgi:DNA repair protein RadC
MEALSDREVIALLLGSPALATQLIAQFGSLSSLRRASLQELLQVKGLGAAKASILLAARAYASRVEKPLVLQSYQEVYHLVRPELEERETEALLLLCLSLKKKLLHQEIIACGTLTSVISHPREIFVPAVRVRAHSIFLAHNHPSGDPSPSEEDQILTDRIAKAGVILGIPLSGHLIVGKGTYATV